MERSVHGESKGALLRKAVHQSESKLKDRKMDIITDEIKIGAHKTHVINQHLSI